MRIDGASSRRSHIDGPQELDDVVRRDAHVAAADRPSSGDITEERLVAARDMDCAARPGRGARINARYRRIDLVAGAQEDCPTCSAMSAPSPAACMPLRR